MASSSSRWWPSAVSKPPFIISNRNGTKLWPNTTQQPPVVSIELEGKGLSADEMRIAQEIARRIVDENMGRLRQYFLRQRMAADGGISPYCEHHTKLGDAIRVRYTKNHSQERLDVKVNANALVEPAPVLEGGQLRGDYAVLGVAVKQPIPTENQTPFAAVHFRFKEPVLNDAMARWYGYVTDPGSHLMQIGQDGVILTEYPLWVYYLYPEQPVLFTQNELGAYGNTGDSSGIQPGVPQGNFFGSGSILVFLEPFKLLGYTRVVLDMYAFVGDTNPGVTTLTRASAVLLPKFDVNVAPQTWVAYPEVYLPFMLSMDEKIGIPINLIAQVPVEEATPEGFRPLNFTAGISKVADVIIDMSTGTIQLDTSAAGSSRSLGFFGSYAPVY